MDLGPHAIFIVASYGLFAGVLGAVAGWLYYDGVRQARALANLEARGITRRSAPGAPEADGARHRQGSK